MKFNKWTVGLAAVGLVSLASAAKAEEKASSVMTALSSTTLSGYVDTSAQWNFGTGNANPAPFKFNGTDKADGFNLDVVQLRIEKPLDESEWAAGYRVDLWAGPDANTLGTQSTLSTGASDFAIRQAYVSLRAPVARGLDFKMGVFDSIIGYESVESPNNPNYTRSYGHTIEPQTHTGLLGTYHFSDMVSASVGVANTVNAAINSRATDGSTASVTGPFSSSFNALYGRIAQQLNAISGAAPGDPNFLTAQEVSSSFVPGSNARAESYKAYMGSVAITAPDTMGALAGSTLYAGVVNGFNNSVLGSGVGDVQTSYYIGATVATPVAGLRAGASFDFLNSETHLATANPAIASVAPDMKADLDAWSIALYASYQATEKLSFHARGEYFDSNANLQTFTFSDNNKVQIWALTATAQYDLWKNVISRVELRWDHGDDHDLFGGTIPGQPTARNAWMLAANVIYKF